MIAKQFANQFHERVRYLEHSGHQNKGTCATRNVGVRNAKGKYIAILDADDIWLPSKLEEQVAILEKNPDAAMLCGAVNYWYSWTGKEEDIRKDKILEVGAPQDSIIHPPNLFFHLYPLSRGVAPTPSDLLLRKDVVALVGGFEEKFNGIFQLYEDQAFLNKIYLHFPVYVTSRCWINYRVHPDSCVSTVTKDGQYNMVRRFFLEWFEEYLIQCGKKGSGVWRLLQEALFPFRAISTDRMQEADTREIKWWLRAARGNTAKLVFPPDDPELVRITIEKAETKTSSDIQLNQPQLRVKADHRYLLHFRARADSPRNIIVGFAKAHEPWDNLGLYRNIGLKTEWQNFDIEFVATADDENARIHFDVGERDISFELSSVSLRSLEDDKSIEPDLSAMLPGRLERDKVSLAGTSDTLLTEERKTAVRQQTEQVATPKEVSFGTLRQVTPISRDWGFDRGLPIDRYYIENFLARYADNIRGRVLEIGDNSYTLRFGCDRVTKSDVLHVEEGNPKATIVADLTSASHISSEIFDCILLIQTLQHIYDVRAAIRTIHRILKPGGVLLATFPGISQTYDHTWGGCWYWNFTTLSARRLFEEVFPAADVEIYAQGNVLASISFLHGLAAEELQKEELDYNDPGYQMLITVRAVK